MEKRGISVFCVAVFSIALMTLAGKGGINHGDVQEENVVSKMQSIAEETEAAETEEQGSVFDEYQALDTNLFENEFLNSDVEKKMKERADEYAKEVQEEFSPAVCEDGSFPEELVVKLEEIWYRRGTDRVFLEILSDEPGELGTQNFRVMDNDGLNRLFPKANLVGGGEPPDKYEWISRFYDIPENTGMLWHIQLLPGKDTYVFRYHETRLQKSRIRLAERIGDEFVTLCEFSPTPSESMSSLGGIQYKDEFYYIVQDKNINVQASDELIIYRLGYDMPRDCMRILYRPKEYVWKEDPSDTDCPEIQPLMESGYMAQVMQDFSTGRYLHEGSWEEGAEVYCGDEKPAFEGESAGKADIVYEMDFTNSGIPVYLQKKLEFPIAGGGAHKKNLGVDFFFYDTEGHSFQKLEELSIPEVSSGDGPKFWDACLVQMWFKRVDEKVYVFRVYNLFDYNYMMSVALMDGETVRPLKRYFLLPRKEFAVREKKAVYQGERVVQGDRYFKVTYVGDFKYDYALYDREGKIIKEGEGQQPLIEYIDDTTIMLETSGEAGERYTVYYDTESGRLSETYVNSLTEGYGKVVYMDEQGEEQVLVVRNMFDRDYYEEFSLDFEPEPVTATYVFISRAGDKVCFNYRVGESEWEEYHIFELNVD